MNDSVLSPKAVYKLLVDNVIAGQTLPPKLALCVKNVLNLMAEPAANTPEDAFAIASAEQEAYLGVTTICARCRSGDNSCRQIEKAKELSTASFAEIEAAAMATSQQQCFSEVKYLFCTRLAQEGEHQNLEKLYQMAKNGQREAQRVLLEQDLSLPNFPIGGVEKQKEYVAKLSNKICSKELSNSVESLTAQGFKYVKDDHAHYLALTSSRLLFTKALQECLTGDADMTCLAHFCKPVVQKMRNNAQFSFSIAHETLLQFLIELRTAKRAE